MPHRVGPSLFRRRLCLIGSITIIFPELFVWISLFWYLSTKSFLDLSLQHLWVSDCCLKDRVLTQSEFSWYLLQHWTKPHIGSKPPECSYPRIGWGLNIKYVTKWPKCLKKSLKMGVGGQRWHLLPCEMGQGRKDWLQNTLVFQAWLLLCSWVERSQATGYYCRQAVAAIPRNFPATVSDFFYSEVGLELCFVT